MFYTAALNIVKANALYAFGTLTMSTAGETDITITLGSVTATSREGVAGATTFWVWASASDTIPDTTYYYCRDHSPYAQDRYASFARPTWAGAVSLALRAAATAATWGSKIPTCSFSSTTGFYSFSLATANHALAWSTANGRALFGFAADATSAATNTGTRTPLFVINPSLLAVSDPTPEYEPDSVGNSTSTDTGAGSGTARYVSPLHCDWVQQFETKEKTLRLNAASTHPYTFQHLREDCRGHTPFLVADGGFNDTFSTPRVFRARDEGIAFVAERATPGNDAQFHLGFHTVVDGHLVSSGS